MGEDAGSTGGNLCTDRRVLLANLCTASYRIIPHLPIQCEVGECRSEVPHVLPMAVNSAGIPVPMETSSIESGSLLSVDMMDETAVSGVGQCMPERSALIKSILNFLKKAIPDPTFAENIRNCE